MSAHRLVLAGLLLGGAVFPAGQTGRAEQPPFRDLLGPFLSTYCVDCHGPKKQQAKLRLDSLAAPHPARKDELATWTAVYEQLSNALMPPTAAVQPGTDRLERVKELLRAELVLAGVALDSAKPSADPNKGNLVDHDALFNQPSLSAPATPGRLWRLSPFAYREFADELTGGRLIVQGGPAVVSKKIPIVASPFGLTSDPGLRDYAYRYRVSGSEAQQLAMNARIILDAMLKKRTRFQPPRVLTAIAEAATPPSSEQIRAAVRHVFALAICREPTRDEAEQFAAFVATRLERLGNRDGLIHGLAPIFLHPEAVFRFEFGAGQPDQHGRLLLGPTELALAIAYALTDRRPDATLLTAARSGKLATRADVRREVARLLDDASVEKPRILRFFREYFGYDQATEVFKDPLHVKAAGIQGKYNAEALVVDTDLLVLHVLHNDRDVLKQLLTTDLSYVGHSVSRRKGARARTDAANHPFGTRPGQSELYKHYNFDLTHWSDKMPLRLPTEQRAGLLTQPSWLIAHSANTENHAIHRGKWVRERLLGGSIPDTPITVEAKLPDEPHHTLRHRMRVTREPYCFKCHQHMDPLGLPFENYDHFGQYRTTELGAPVDATGEIVRSGEAKLDGKVTNALEMIRKLAESERVHQVFVRHAFRYWMGRNETLDDAATLQAAFKDYRASHGSMKALIAALLTSDSFLYRRPETPAVHK